MDSKKQRQESRGVSLPPSLWRAVMAYHRRAKVGSAAALNLNQAVADLIRRGLEHEKEHKS